MSFVQKRRSGKMSFNIFSRFKGFVFALVRRKRLLPFAAETQMLRRLLSLTAAGS
jgi:hypothetical protein